MSIDPRAEEVWSYLIGVVPVGRPFKLDRRMAEDLGMTFGGVRTSVTKLKKAGVVIADKPGYVVVKERNIPYKEPWAKKNTEPVEKKGDVIHPRVGTRSREAHIDALRLMAEIPDDTRDLTGRLMGDPLPQRSALYRSKCSEGA